MIVPVAARVGSPFGWRVIAGRDDYHSGIDYGAHEGAPVRAAADGTVRGVWEPGELARYGRVIVLEHPATPAPLFTLYAHLGASSVERGQTVRAGDVIGAVGDTAGTRDEPGRRVERAHLHFELLTRWPPRGIDQDRIDPAPYLEPGAAPLEPATKAAAGAGGVLAILAALWYARERKRRPRSRVPAPDHPTLPEGQWRT